MIVLGVQANTRYRRAGRPVIANGVAYPSMIEACRALGVTYTRMYYLLGERWRFPSGRRRFR